MMVDSSGENWGSSDDRGEIVKPVVILGKNSRPARVARALGCPSPPAAGPPRSLHQDPGPDWDMPRRFPSGNRGAATVASTGILENRVVSVMIEIPENLAGVSHRGGRDE